MKSVHIRNVESDTLDRLRRLAALHHRSLQGELKAILEEAARRAPTGETNDKLDLITVEEDTGTTWRREEIYRDDSLTVHS